METTVIYELIGYAASALVAISLMMSAIVKLRVINLIGSLTFCIYGILIGSIPVAAMNGFIVFVNIYYLFQIYRDDEYFKLLKVSDKSEYLREFIFFYRDHIHQIQPNFKAENNYDFSVFVLRDMVPAGLLIGNRETDHTLLIHLDFVIPNYRDFKIAEFLFDKNRSFFIETGIHKVVAVSETYAHNQYLKKIGFVPSGKKETRFELDLS